MINYVMFYSIDLPIEVIKEIQKIKKPQKHIMLIGVYFGSSPNAWPVKQVCFICLNYVGCGHHPSDN